MNTKIWITSALSWSLLACAPQVNLPPQPEPQTPQAENTSSSESPAETLPYPEALLARFGAYQRGQATQMAAVYDDPDLLKAPGLGSALAGAPAALPAASMGPSQPESPLTTAQQAELLQSFQNLFRGQSQSITQLEQNLKTLSPPAEFAAGHQAILKYLSLQYSFLIELLSELEETGVTLLLGEPPSHYQQKLIELAQLRTAAHSALTTLQIGFLQQELSPPPGREALSAEAYQTRLQTIFDNPRALSGPPVFFELLTSPGSGEQKRAYIQQTQIQYQQQMTALREITPPEVQSRAHAVLFGFLKLESQILGALSDELLEAEVQPEMPMAQLGKVYADPALAEDIFWLSALFSEVAEVGRTLNG